MVLNSHSVTEETKAYGALVWEIFHIMKEHFPSRIQLQEENLLLCMPVHRPISKNEELRRQMSLLEVKKEEGKRLTTSEVIDLHYMLEWCQEVKEHRHEKTILEVLLSPQVSQKDLHDSGMVDLIDSLIPHAQWEANRKLMQEVMDKLLAET